MQVGDVEPHMGIVDGALCLGLPGVICRGVIGEYADDLDIFDILEHVLGRIDQLSAKDEVKALRH